MTNCQYVLIIDKAANVIYKLGILKKLFTDIKSVHFRYSKMTEGRKT